MPGRKDGKKVKKVTSVRINKDGKRILANTIGTPQRSLDLLILILENLERQGYKVEIKKIKKPSK